MIDIIIVLIFIGLFIIFMSTINNEKPKTPREKAEYLVRSNERLCNILIFACDKYTYSQLNENFATIIHCFDKVKEDRVFKCLSPTDKSIITSQYIRLLNKLRSHGHPVRSFYLQLREFTISWIKKIKESNDMDKETQEYLTEQLHILLSEIHNAND